MPCSTVRSFAASIADLAREVAMLFVEHDGLARLAQIVVGDAEVAEGVAFAA